MSINTGIPLLLATPGLLVNEHSSVLNLGVEGMMLVVVTVGSMAGYQTQIPLLGSAAGASAGMVMVVLFAWLALVLVINQVATGLTLSIFGTGLSAFTGQHFVGIPLLAQAHGIPGLESIPFVGPIPFAHHWAVYSSLLLCGATAQLLFKTRVGLALRAVGGSPESAHALGCPVRTVRFDALLFGGACYELAGAYLSLVYTPIWVENMIAGRGWTALAPTTFATWRPLHILFGAPLFGGAMIPQSHLQEMGVSVPPQVLSMAPLTVTIVALAIISCDPDWIRLNMSVSLSKPFRPGAA